MKFYLGTHIPKWLNDTDELLFVSRRTLVKQAQLPKAVGRWALDSGGFSELQMFGGWQTPAMQYSTEVRRFHDEVGGLEWAAIQDWMCEEIVIRGGETPSGAKFKGTGLSVREHQKRTVHSWHLLRQLAPDMPWVPVLQGQHPDDYLAHAEMYKESGTDLAKLPLVGVGSVCRRQAMDEAMHILIALHTQGIKLHGFGFKISGLANGAAALLESADSMAWSRGARFRPRTPGCTHVFKKPPKIGTPSPCGNCKRYALIWRDQVLKAIRRGERVFRPRLFG